MSLYHVQRVWKRNKDWSEKCIEKRFLHLLETEPAEVRSIISLYHFPTSESDSFPFSFSLLSIYYWSTAVFKQAYQPSDYHQQITIMNFVSYTVIFTVFANILGQAHPGRNTVASIRDDLEYIVTTTEAGSSAVTEAPASLSVIPHNDQTVTVVPPTVYLSMVTNWMTVNSLTFRTTMVRKMTTITTTITVKSSDLEPTPQKAMLVPLRDIESSSETLSAVALPAPLIESQSHHDPLEVLTTGSTQPLGLAADSTAPTLTTTTTVQRTETSNEIDSSLIANSVSMPLAGPDIVTGTEAYIIQLNIGKNLRTLPTQSWGATGIPLLVMSDWLPAPTLGTRQTHISITNLQSNIAKYAQTVASSQRGNSSVLSRISPLVPGLAPLLAMYSTDKASAAKALIVTSVVCLLLCTILQWNLL